MQLRKPQRTQKHRVQKTHKVQEGCDTFVFVFLPEHSSFAPALHRWTAPIQINERVFVNAGLMSEWNKAVATTELLVCFLRL